MRGGALLALAGWLLAAAPLAGQDPSGISLTFRDSVARVEPGGAWNAVLVVRNPTRVARRLTPALEILPGWKTLAAGTVLVPARGSEIVIVSVAVPASAIAGRHALPLRLLADDGVRVWSGVLPVEVPARPALTLVPLGAPRFARADTVVRARFAARNVGNVPLTLDVRAESHRGTAQVDSARLSLAPGAASVVTVAVRSVSLGVASEQSVALRMRGDRWQADSTATVELLRVPDEPSALGSFPLRARLRATAQQVTPLELSGSAAHGADTLELFVRQPGRTFSLLGERDEYRVRIARRGGSLELGDVTLSDGPVRDTWQALFGAQLRLRHGPFAASGYSARDRLMGSEVDERGAALAWKLRPLASLGVGMIERTGESAGRVWRSFAEIGARNPAASSLSAEVDGGADGISAIGVRARGRSERGWLDLGSARVGAQYPGAERGTSRVSIGVGGPVGRDVAVRLLASRYGTDSVSGRPFSFRATSLNAAVTRRGLSAEVRADERAGLAHVTRYDVAEVGAKLGATASAGRTTLTAGLEAGRAEDRITAAATPFQRVSAGITMSAWSRLSAGLRGEWLGRSGTEDNSIWSGNANLSAQLTRSTSLSVNGGVFQVVLPVIMSYATVHAQLSQELPFGHSVVVRAQGARLSGGMGAASVPASVYLEYGLPLNVPVPRGPAGRRRVSGRVVEYGSGESVPGALVRIGEQMAISNRDGRVVFLGPLPPDGTLSVERADGPANMVVQTASGSAASGGFTVTVAQGGRIRGHVARYDIARVQAGRGAAEPSDSLVRGDGLPGIVVRLHRGADTVTVLTDADGEFDSGTVPPGDWLVSVDAARLPSAYGVERKALAVRVPAGQTVTPEIRVVPRFREATLEAGGELRMPDSARRP